MRQRTRVDLLEVLKAAADALKDAWQANEKVGQLIDGRKFEFAIEDYLSFPSQPNVVFSGQFPSAAGKLIWNKHLAPLYWNATMRIVFQHLDDYGVSFAVFDYVPIRPCKGQLSSALKFDDFLAALYEDKALLEKTIAFRDALLQYWGSSCRWAWGDAVFKLENFIFEQKLSSNSPASYMRHPSPHACRSDLNHLRLVRESLDQIICAASKNTSLLAIVRKREEQKKNRLDRLGKLGVDIHQLLRSSPSAIYMSRSIFEESVKFLEFCVSVKATRTIEAFICQVLDAKVAISNVITLAASLGSDVGQLLDRILGSDSAVCRVIDCKQIWKMRRKKKSCFSQIFFFFCLVLSAEDVKQEIFAKFVQLADLLGVEVKTMSMRVFGSGSAVCRIIDCKQIWKMRRKKKKLFFSNFFFLFGFVSERREARNFCKICAAG